MKAASLVQACCCPIYAEMLRPRVVALSLAAIGGAQVFFSMHGFGMPCMFLKMTGCPCPGCGLTRSVMAMLHGQVGESLRWHPLGPALLAGMTVALVAAVLPGNMRDWLVGVVGRMEARTGLVAWMAGLLMAIWLLRIFAILPLNKLT